jgi:oligopeptide transport system permease protein
MLRYILNRLLSAAITIWFIATATFFIMHAVPGDPFSQEKAVSENIRQNLEARYGLDKPLLTQYGIFLGNTLKGDFGISYVQENREVNDIIREHFPVSAVLGAVSLWIALVFAILLGALAALFRDRWQDNVVLLGVVAAISVPSFVIAALAQLAIVNLNGALGWELLPVAGWGSVNHIWVPALVLGLGTLAYLTRLMRSSLLDVMSADFSLTARSKGLTTWQIFYRHQLRNALLPVVTELGPTIAAVTTGGFVVELVFAIPGMGRYFVEAVQHLDYTVIMGTTVFYGAFLVLMVLLVDILYGWVDPRIRLVKRGVV